jgi:hypothetical protein
MFAEAQSFVRIAREYPVLSIGVAVEKGYELARRRIQPVQRLDRRTWDWRHLVRHVETLLAVDVLSSAKLLSRPVN